MKKILITGAAGQVGSALLSSAPTGYSAVAANRAVLDITDQKSVLNWVVDNKPDGIINAAAYTAVDLAEEESVMAFSVNADGPRNLALAAAELAIPLVHISTDFVFDGQQATPYKPADLINPLSVYGESKARGEGYLAELYSEKSSIIRTSWVYSMGHGNFVSTMIRLMKEKDQLSVVADQIGTPTSASPLSEACWQILNLELSGIFHWSDAGVASWYDFAVAIQEEAIQAGVLSSPIPIQPVTTNDFPTAAVRPAYSVLEKTASWQKLGLTSRHWREALRNSLAEISS